MTLAQLTLRPSPVAQRVQRIFLGSGRRELARLAVEESDGCLRIHGQLPNHYFKQLAQALALTTPGVSRIDNTVTIS